MSEWQCVPTEPTLAMRAAYKLALKEYILSLPPEMRKSRRRGVRVCEEIKITLRWRAMLSAAPRPTGGEG